MAKSKNHTSHHQNRKDHRNGIKRPKKIPIRSFNGQDRTFVFNLRKSRKNNQTPAQGRHQQSVSIIKNRILFNIIKDEGKRVKHARELGQSLLRKRIHSRPQAKVFIRQLSGDQIRAQLTKRLVTKPKLAEAAARIAKAKAAKTSK